MYSVKIISKPFWGETTKKKKVRLTNRKNRLFFDDDKKNGKLFGSVRVFLVFFFVQKNLGILKK